MAPAELRERALETIITIRIQLQEAAYAGIFVGSEAVERALEQISRSNDVGLDEFLDQVESAGITPENLRLIVRNELIISRLVDLVIEPSVRIADREISVYLDKYRSEFGPVLQYDLDAIVLHVPSEATSAMKADLMNSAELILQELENGIRFQEMARELSQYEGVEAGSLGWTRIDALDRSLAGAVQKAGLRSYAGPVDVGDAIFIVGVKDRRTVSGIDVAPSRYFRLRQLLIRYKNESQRETVIERLNRFRERIANGESFADLARRYTEVAQFRESGGEIGWVAEEDLPPDLVAQLDALDVDDLTQVAIFDDSAVLFQLLGTRLANEEENIRKAVVQSLRRRRTQDAHVEWLRERRAESQIIYREVL